MRAINRFLFLSTLSGLLVGCGGDGNGNSQPVEQVGPPEPPVVTVEADIKQLIFSWGEVSGATHYRLMEDPDGHSGFTQTGEDIPAGTPSVTKQVGVHLHDWVNALYVVQACNTAGCTGSTEVNTMNQVLDTIGYFKGSNTEGCEHNNPEDWCWGDDFGGAVALSADGTTLAVGARREDSAATGVNGDQSDNSSDGSGAVYLFRFEGNEWHQQAYIKASNTDASDGFGFSLGLSADGTTMAVGSLWEGSNATGINGDQSDNSAEGSGAAYIFRFDGDEWRQQAYVKASITDSIYSFGSALALSADGETLAVVASAEQSDDGAVYVFRFDSADWYQHARFQAEDPEWDAYFGYSLSLSSDGATIAVGAPGKEQYVGAVYLFRFNGTDWYQQSYIQGSNTGWGLNDGCGKDEDPWCFGDKFGTSVSLSADGNTLAVGAMDEDSAATGINGDEEDNSIHSPGAAYLFRFDGATWLQQAYIKASNTGEWDIFGGHWRSVSLSADGNTLAVGARDEDSAATGINGDQNDNSANGAGAVYLFRFESANWSQFSYIKGPTTGSSDGFGRVVSLSADGKTLAVGALGEDSAATGINGDQSDNSAENSGGVYLY